MLNLNVTISEFRIALLAMRWWKHLNSLREKHWETRVTTTSNLNSYESHGGRFESRKTRQEKLISVIHEKELNTHAFVENVKKRKDSLFNRLFFYSNN